MLWRMLLSVWCRFGSDRAGFCSGTCSWATLVLLMFCGGFQASLSVGPGGNFPTLADVLLYALSHDDLPSLLVTSALLLLFGPCQERRWGTVAFLSLSVLTMTILPLLYTLVLFVGSGEASRFCGYSAIQLTLFTAQCRQVTQRKLLRCVPVWFLPWILLLAGLLLLPGTPALLHFCAICIGHNYHQPFIVMLQELEEASVFRFIPDWAYVPTSARVRLPTYTTSHKALPQVEPVDQAASPTTSSKVTRPPWNKESAALSDAEMLEEQMLTAGILASLQDAPDAKVEVPKSSVSSLRLQQLEKMGFPTEKAVVALAASKQLDGAISLLIDDSVGEEAVVVSKGKSHLPMRRT